MTRAIAALGGVIAESLVDENGAAPGLKATPGSSSFLGPPLAAWRLRSGGGLAASPLTPAESAGDGPQCRLCVKFWCRAASLRRFVARCSRSESAPPADNLAQELPAWKATNRALAQPAHARQSTDAIAPGPPPTPRDAATASLS